jgi:hypothetical protein
MRAFVWDFEGSQRIPEGNSIGNLRNSLGTFKFPHKCSHTFSFHFKVGHQKGLGVDGYYLWFNLLKEE